jgi:hypothetical protein
MQLLAKHKEKLDVLKALHWVKKKYLWFWFPTDPIFFCRPYYFFNGIDRATLFSPGGCGLLPKWRLLSH